MEGGVKEGEFALKGAHDKLMRDAGCDVEGLIALR
jgi:hypothetical protein